MNAKGEQVYMCMYSNLNSHVENKVVCVCMCACSNTTNKARTQSEHHFSLCYWSFNCCTAHGREKQGSKVTCADVTGFKIHIKTPIREHPTQNNLEGLYIGQALQGKYVGEVCN